MCFVSKCTCMSIGWLAIGRHCKYMVGFVRVARQQYMGKEPKNQQRPKRHILEQQVARYSQQDTLRQYLDVFF